MKDEKPPVSTFFFLSLVSNKKTKWDWQRHLRAFENRLWPAHLPYLPSHICSSLTSPLPINGQSPPAPISFLFPYSFFSLEWPVSFTLQGSALTPLLCTACSDVFLELTIPTSRCLLLSANCILPCIVVCCLSLKRL